MAFSISTIGPPVDQFGNKIKYSSTLLRLCNNPYLQTCADIDLTIELLEQNTNCYQMHIQLSSDMPSDLLFNPIKRLWKYFETCNVTRLLLQLELDSNSKYRGYTGWLYAFVDAISLNTNITELTLCHRHNTMSYETTLSLAGLIKVNKTITMLAIECCKIEPMIYEAMSQNTTIKHLSISYAGQYLQSFIALHRYLCKTTTLTDITLRGSDYSSSSELYRPMYIFNCRSIRNITLLHCSRWGLTDICSIPTTLRRIKSSAVVLDDAGSHAFVKQLMDNYSITECDIALVTTMQILLDAILQRNRLLMHEDIHKTILNYVIVLSSIVNTYDGINAYLIVDILDLIDEQIYRIMPKTKVGLVLNILQSINKLR